MTTSGCILLSVPGQVPQACSVVIWSNVEWPAHLVLGGLPSAACDFRHMPQSPGPCNPGLLFLSASSLGCRFPREPQVPQEHSLKGMGGLVPTLIHQVPSSPRPSDPLYPHPTNCTHGKTSTTQMFLDSLQPFWGFSWDLSIHPLLLQDA